MAAAAPVAFVAAGPSGETERRLRVIWERVLGVSGFGADDNFFDLGGNSLSLVEAHEAVREAFGVAPSLLDLFRLPTIRALVALLDGTPRATPAPPVPRAGGGERRTEAIARAKARSARARLSV